VIDPKKCEVKIHLLDGKEPAVAKVSFYQDGARISYFRLKESDGKMWLEPPKLNTGFKWVAIFFDENASRFKKLELIAIKAYRNMPRRVRDPHAEEGGRKKPPTFGNGASLSDDLEEAGL
jgi:hypothetical protein